jgi:phosphoserine aminotransferase
MSRVYNFGAGPSVLPLEALEEAQRELVDFRGSGMSILESSHRGKEYAAVHDEAVANVKALMGVPDNYSVLFLQGGASMQFAMVPLNLLVAGQTADYTNSGAWAAKAIKEARLVGKVNIAADCGDEIPARVPAANELRLTRGAAYVHITSNEGVPADRRAVGCRHVIGYPFPACGRSEFRADIRRSTEEPRTRRSGACHHPQRSGREGA